jgi:hypothetical protein
MLTTLLLAYGTDAVVVVISSELVFIGHASNSRPTMAYLKGSDAASAHSQAQVWQVVAKFLLKNPNGGPYKMAGESGIMVLVK